MAATWSYDIAFSRHAGLLSRDEQYRLRKSRVAIAGLGGVGGIHLVTLGRLGVGEFVIADFDHFEMSNFNRQYGAHVDTLGKPKAEVMAREIRQINPEVKLRVFDEGIRDDIIGDFLDGVDLFVDGMDFFEIGMRRKLFRQAAENGIYGITAAPLGYGTAWLTFDPVGMSFDEYFDLHDDQPEDEQLVSFVVGLAPDALHFPYVDWTAVNFVERRGPSTGLACQLCAGVVAGEAIKILLGRGCVRYAPEYAQFDSYQGILSTGSLPLGNRQEDQRQKRLQLCQILSELSRATTPQG